MNMRHRKRVVQGRTRETGFASYRQWPYENNNRHLETDNYDSSDDELEYPAKGTDEQEDLDQDISWDGLDLQYTAG
jgi:hypothetical protein